MDKELEKWLLTKTTKKTLVMLKKEQLVTESVMCQLKDEDLQQLKTQHSLTMGQFIELREARDAILQGAFARRGNGSVATSEPGQSRDVSGTEEPATGDHVGTGEPATGDHVGTGEPATGGHDRTGEPAYATGEPATATGEPATGDSDGTEVEKISTGPANATADSEHAQDRIEHCKDLRNRLEKAEQLNKQGHTQEAGEHTEAVIGEVQEMLDGIRAHSRPEHLSQDIGNIGNAMKAFETGNQTSRSCCLLL